ncbi:alpha-amylase [Pseudoalteromonas xiamenensis]|uniref:Alpha-amylase n=1 Tax=Pseudoalteromonas xiamenensis TaxID=882626 RepID=A0A975DHW9_9GAMM|nr:alpha-amylase family protein [Pseudoalteromonas xiamenensis]QTH72163.1 alpha-amylase family protein [Pseudoalteromonas xiamenensis]
MTTTALKTFKIGVLFGLGTLCQSSAIAAPTTFVHLFEWSWQDVAKECETYLGPRGYAAVQVSPPNEHVTGDQWWTRYQPVSYALTSRGGSRAEFVDMVARCKAAGVNIYVDAVINHMAAGSGQGVAGTSFTLKQFPIYNTWDFHDTCAINNEDYGNNPWRVQNCELVSLPDLNTGSSYVQGKLAGYLNDLISVGVAGFRLDASKHMAASDIASVLSQVNGAPLVFQEVIDQGGEAVSASEYFGNGLVTEFKYTTKLGETFKSGKLAWLSNFGEAWGMMPSYKAVVFVDNHDNQRGHGGAGNVVTYQDGALYDLANVFMLAYPYGYPKVMSSFDYHHDTDAGGPTYPVHDGANLNCFGDGWQCEHRHQKISGAVDFRNNTNDVWQISNWWDNGNNQIAFSRGASGFVAINRENGTMQQTLQTGLSVGRYCDVLSGQISADKSSCSGQTIDVDANGFALVNVPAMNAVAIHKGAKLEGSSSANWKRTVVFIKAQTQSGQDMFVRGGIDYAYAASQGKNCNSNALLCALPIRHNNLLNTTTQNWKQGDNYLDWQGLEATQGAGAEGSALDWTTNIWPSAWGTKRTVSVDGYGETPLNQWGDHYWMLDVDMDCANTVNGWFEVKAFVKNGQGWEGDIQQAGAPYQSKNHFAQCGRVNVFEFGQNQTLIQDF